MPRTINAKKKKQERGQKYKVFKLKLAGYEIATLKINGELLKSVPYISSSGTPYPRTKIMVQIRPDDVDEFGNVILWRRGGKVRPIRQRQARRSRRGGL